LPVLLPGTPANSGLGTHRGRKIVPLR
jgi:hypothetical protein